LIAVYGRTRRYSLEEAKADGMEKVEVTRRNITIRGKVAVAWLGQPTLDKGHDMSVAMAAPSSSCSLPTIPLT
jgi:hypothetical protein